MYWKREVKERNEESAIAIEDTKFSAENKKSGFGIRNRIIVSGIENSGKEENLFQSGTNAVA